MSRGTVTHIDTRNRSFASSQDGEVSSVRYGRIRVVVRTRRFGGKVNRQTRRSSKKQPLRWRKVVPGNPIVGLDQQSTLVSLEDSPIIDQSVSGRRDERRGVKRSAAMSEGLKVRKCLTKCLASLSDIAERERERFDPSLIRKRPARPAASQEGTSVAPHGREYLVF